MLHDPERHEPLDASAWDEARARDAIHRIVTTTEQIFSPRTWWPTHPRLHDGPGPDHLFYSGAAGVIWALQDLAAQGAIHLQRDYAACPAQLLAPNAAEMGDRGRDPFGSYLMGHTSIRMLAHCLNPDEGEHLDEAERLIRGNMHHPTRELMWGAPGTLLAAQLLHEHTGEPRWAALFRETAQMLWNELRWSEAEACHYWTQDMYGERSDFLDAVHGFIGAATPLIHGRHLLAPGDWDRWAECIVRTVRSQAEWEGPLVNWRARLSHPRGHKLRMQVCHGSPGFVVFLADFPGDALDDLLLAGGLATWAAGPLRKGPNLCHGTGGNGYAFLKLYRRTGDAVWLARARAFAMHGIAQMEAERQRHGRLNFSLWTGDLGFALFLWDCIRGSDRFPSIDRFFGAPAPGAPG